MTNPMTPTEQDNELREKISHRFDSVCAEGHQQSCGEYQTAVDDVMQLIIADRKRVALEARIGTLNKLKNTRPNAETDDATADYLRGYREMEAKVGFELNRLRKQRKLV